MKAALPEAVTGGILCAALLAACTSGNTVQPPQPTSHTNACVVSTARRGKPPPAIHPAEPQPVPWIAGFTGNRALWVGLPRDSMLHSDTPHARHINVKFPWWRLKTGYVMVTARRLDGPSKGFSASVGNGAYGPTGFDPSELSFPSAGCWQITGTLPGGSLTITLRAAR